MSMIVLIGSVEQGLIYALVALGLFLSYRILGIADLTVDGSFTLGAAVSAMLTISGHPTLGLAMAMLAGGLAGIVTAVLQTKLGIASILAGIITMTALYSINLQVTGERANVPLLRVETIFTKAETMLGEALEPFATLILLFMIASATAIFLILFLKTRLGLSLRATGDNILMVRASSINPSYTITVGLCIANAMVALSGALLAQYQNFWESTMGTGMVVIGLASLIIGEVITRCERYGGIKRAIIGVIIGAVLYRIIMALALSASISSSGSGILSTFLAPSNLKLLSAIIVAGAISYPMLGKFIAFQKLKKETANANT